MRSFLSTTTLTTTALITLIALTPVAFAATMADGTIKAIDMKAMTLTLNSGQTYHLPVGFKDPGLKVGEKVALSIAASGKNEASAVTIVK